VIGSWGFLFLVIGPHKHAPGPFDLRLRLVKYFRLRDGIGPRTPPLAFAVTPPGGFEYVLRTSAMGSGGVCRATILGRWGREAGKMPALHRIERPK
jgi:hypothetical protein